MNSMTCVTTGCRNPVHKEGNRFCSDHAIEFLTQALDKRTLRDELAGQALLSIGTWIPAHGGSELGTKKALEARALWAYEQADAMLSERVKGGF